MESRETMSRAHQHQEHSDAESLLAHADFLRALVSRLVVDQSTADDILQATWLSALKHPPRAGGSVRAWLYRVAQNHVRQLHRGDGRRSAREQEVRRSAQVPSAADIVERESARRTVVDAVVGLPEHYREVILLRFYEDLPPRKVARTLGIPVETVRSRTRRGLALLRQHLDGEYGDDRKSWTVALLPLLVRPSAPALVSGTTLVVCATALFVAGGLLLGWDLLAGTGGLQAEAVHPGLVALAPPLAPVEIQPAAPPGSRAAPLVPANTLSAPAAPASTPTPTASLAGRVVDSTGAAVLGAEVLAFGGARPTLQQDHRGATTTAPIARAQSGADGQFELAGLPLEFYLRAQRDDLVSVAGLVGTLSGAQSLAEVELVVTPGLSVTGRVVTPDGTPVPDCRLELRTVARRGFVRPTAHADLVTGAMAVFATTTDAEGQFRLRHLPAAKHFLHARHPDFAPGQQYVLPGEPGALEIELPPGARSRVRVTDSEGQPLEGCSIAWISEDQIPATARTDAQGRALLPAVPIESRGHILAQHPGLAPTYSPALDAGGAVLLRLTPAQEISGTVIDEEGLAVSGAHVEARAGAWSVNDEFPTASRAHQARGAVRTDAAGRFRLGGLGDGVHHLTATVPGSRVPGATGAATPGQDPVRLVVGSDAPGTVSLRGQVRDARSGAPITAFVLSARGPGDTRLAEVIESPSGEFEVALPAREHGAAGTWTIVVRAEGCAPWDLSAREFSAASGPLEIELFPSRNLHVVLRDARDQPVANARIVISDLRGRPVIANMSEGIWMGSILVGPSGEARLSGLPARPLLLQVRVPELPRLPSFEVDLTSEQSTAPRELLLPYDLSSPRRTVTVNLRGDAHRVPLRVEVFDEPGTLVAGWIARHDDEGKLHVAKPMRHLVVRYDEHGHLTHRGQAWLPADHLTQDLGAQLVESDDEHALFRAHVPLAPCRVVVTLPSGEVVVGQLPRDAASVLLELP